jgi:dUTP pyrophosphatase
MKTIVKIKPLVERFQAPHQMHQFDAGFDCYYNGDDEIEIPPISRALVPLGFSMEIEPGYEAQLRPRSGLAKKNGLTILNSPGTIDALYRGPVGALILNTDKDYSYIIKPGERICQMVIAPIPAVTLEIVDELSETSRGTGGFGSTGK